MFRSLFKILFFFMIICTLYLKISFAFMPQDTDVEDAIKNGKVAFIGRVIELKEIQRQDYKTIAEIKLQLLNCYYGLDCNKNKFLTIRYFSETVLERILPVDFSISTELLIILNRPISSHEIFFDSDFKDGADMAYIIGDTFPKGYYENTKLRLINIYLENSINQIDQRDLKKWIKERDTDRKQNTSKP